MSQTWVGTGRPGRGVTGRILLGTMVALVATACVARPGESGLTSAGPDATVASASPSQAASIEASAALTPTASTSASPSATASSTTTATATASAHLSATPSVLPSPASGRWTGVHWYATTVPAFSGSRAGKIDVFGWSGGYVAFTAITPDPNAATADRPAIEVLRSRDGTHWSSPVRLNPGVAIGGGFRVFGLHEGPAGLLAEAGEWGVTCGGPPSIDALWLSKDGGASWAAVSVSGAFAGGRALTLSGGSAGYVATGSIGAGDTTPAVWVSTDGRIWRPAKVPAAGAATEIDGAVAFSGGFVASGAVVGPEGCGGVQLLTTALWYSKDGAAWVQGDVPGRLTAPNASMTVRRIDDHALLAIGNAYDPATDTGSRAAWVSTDGKVWQTADWALGADGNVIGDGRHSVVMSGPDEKGVVRIMQLTSSALVTLAQSGTLPWGPETYARLQALGPAGLLATDDAGRVWIGVPTSN